MERAVDIAQRILDITGAALATKDFARFVDCFQLPLTLGTDAGLQKVETAEAYRAIFDRAVARYDALGVTRLDRRVEAAYFDGDDTVRTSHVSQPFRGDTPLTPPYPNYSTIRRDGAAWRVTHVHHMLRHFDGHAEALLGRDGADVPGDSEDGEALDILQAVLDRGTEAVLTRNFDAFADTVHLPLFLQGARASTIIDSIDALRADFDRRLGEFELSQITDIVRRAKQAEHMGPDRIHGTYRTHILRGAMLALPSYTSAMTLECREDGIWRTSMVTHPTDSGGPRPARHAL